MHALRKYSEFCAKSPAKLKVTNLFSERNLTRVVQLIAQAQKRVHKREIKAVLGTGLQFFERRR